MPDALAVARAVINAAPPEALRAALLALLDDAPAPARPPVTAKARTVPTRAPPADPAWEALRRDVRSRMKASGTTYAALSAACGRSAATLQLVLTRAKPASAPTQAALRAWLDANGTAAPAVAPAAPFRRGTTSPAAARRANGTATPP